MDKTTRRYLLVAATAVLIILYAATGKRQTASLSNERLPIEDGPAGSLDTKNVLEKRRISLERRCSRLRRVSYIDYREARDNLVDYDWMYVPQFKLFYCSVPKVASTTIKMSLMNALGFTVNGSVESVHEQAVIKLAMGQWNVNTSSADVPLARSDRNPFSKPQRGRHSLIIVRNPYERLVSAFKDKIVNKGGDVEHLQHFCLAYPPVSNENMKKYKLAKSSSQVKVTFSEFINCVLSNYASDIPFFDDHIAPITKICSICLIRYDFIVRKENFLPEMSHVLSQLEGDTTLLRDDLLLQQRQLNQASTHSLVLADYQRLYRQLSARQLERLQLMYRHDFEIFGYSEKISDFFTSSAIQPR